jgi:hypothetical protein
MPARIICEGRKIKLKHLKKGFVFTLVDNQEWLGKFEVLNEIDKTGTVLTRNVSPGFGDKWVLDKFTEDNL